MTTNVKDALCGPVAPKEAKRRYTRDLTITMALYTLAVIVGALATVWIVANEHPRWWAIFPAVLPIPPILFGLRAYLTLTRSMDELERRVQSEAMMISLAIVGFSSFAYGFLEEWAAFPHVPLLWVLPALIGIWGVAQALVRRRFQ